ncbi:hypothetical protein [Lysinibacillus sp. 38-6]|uniref:hypothetical protein n=1 Tax=Lysinibacillus sp. 38-6 TaxID=3385991 RepID=UPI0039088A81
MRTFWKNENGYSLLITFAIIIIFTVLGLSLLTLTTSGITKNNTREEIVQAQDLSDKGIEYAVKDIQAFLAKNIKDNPMGKTAFELFLENTLKSPKLSCTSGIKIPAENKNETNVCIEKIERISSEEKDQYKRLVTFKSTGKVNNREHVTRSQVIIGTDAIPDQLRYAVSSNDNGSIYFYGGVDIKGDIKTAKDLVIHNQGYYLSGTTPSWTNSVYTRLKADSKSVTPKIILPESGNLFVTNSIKHLKSESNILNLDVNKNLSSYTKYKVTDPALQTFARSTFFDSKNVSIVTKTLDADSVKIQEKVTNSYQNSSYTEFYKNSLTITNSNKNSVNLTKNDVVLIGGTKTINTTCKTYNGKYCIEWNTREEFLKGSFKINASPVNLRGQYLVFGDLTISNSTLNSDAIIYVDGDVYITDSTLNGLGSNGTLIIFASGQIKLINISKYEEVSSKIKGFFYSQDTLNIFGVFSNIQIQGGISAKNIVLSAVRGKYTSGGSTDTSAKQGELVDHDKDPNTPPIPSKSSRLSIIYDQDLIESYTSFKRDEEEEFITELNDPETINRY